MADLSKLSARGGKQDQASYRRDGFGPRRQTDLPGLEVNARISRGNTSGAEQLQRILGLATDTAEAVSGALGRKQEIEGQKQAGQAAVDATLGVPDAERYAKSQEYRKAFDYEKATAGAIQLDTTLAQAVQERLNDTENPATLDDITELVNGNFSQYALNPDGTPRNFGSPEAQIAVARQLSQTRARLFANAASVIKQQTDERTLNTIAGNIVFERTQALAQPLTAPPVPGAVTATPAAPAAVIAEPTARYTMAPNGFVATSSLHDLFGSVKGVRISGLERSVARNKAVNGVPNSQHIGSDANHASAIDMVGITPGSARKILADHGLTGEVIHHDAGSGMHVHIESVRPVKQVGDPLGANNPSPVSAAPPPVRSAPVDFEAMLARVPTTIDRGTAKKYLLGALIQAADENNDDGLMDGLWQSKRPDGTPSFNPTEIGLLRDERDRIRDNVRVKADRERTKKWEANADILTTSIINGNPPSDATLREWVNRNDIDPKFAYSLIQHNEAERKADEREARADARAAATERAASLSMTWAAEMEQRRLGVRKASGYNDDVQRLRNGELGQGKAAVALFKQLRAADRAGEIANLDPTRNPDIAKYASAIGTRFAPPKRATGNSVIASLSNGAASAAPDDPRPAMQALYKQRLKEGKDPALAYADAVATYAPKKEDRKDAVAASIAALRARRAASGR